MGNPMRPPCQSLQLVVLFSSLFIITAGVAWGEDTADDGAAGAVEQLEESDDRWIDWTDWRPSVSLGVTGNQRWITSSTDGVLATNQNIVNQKPQAFTDPESDGQLAQAGLPVGGQLMAPAIEKLPWQPRLFAQGGYVHLFGSDELVSSVGEPRLNWFGLGVLPMRVEMRGRSESIWFAGGGVAWKLPWEHWESHIKLSVNYYEESVEITGLVDALNTTPQTSVTQLTHVVRGLGPGIGLDVELGRRWGTALGLFFDTQVDVPLDDDPVVFGTSINYDVNPLPPPFPTDDHFDGGTQYFTFDPGIRFSAAVGIRITWVGR